MKFIITIFIAAFTLSAISSCSNEKDSFFYEGIVIISGDIVDWNPDEDNHTISLINNDLASGTQQTFIERISNDGSFKFEIDIYHEKDIWLIFNKKFKTLYIRPGDSLFIQTRKETFEFSTNIEGTAAKENMDLQKFEKMFDTFWTGDPDSRITELGPVKYKEYIFSSLQMSLDSLYNSYLDIVEPEKDIAQWVKIHIDYLCATELMAMVFHRNLDVPDDYWNFLINIP